jgi:phosphoribosylformylglycinamidine (FGAM) synthase-like amidotransferase family enzyme
VMRMNTRTRTKTLSQNLANTTMNIGICHGIQILKYRPNWTMPN